MILKEYHKLVRDYILRIIRKDNERPIARQLTLEEFREVIRHKLVEEAQEVARADTRRALITELADVLEVFYTILKFFGIELREVERVRVERRNLRGGFDSRVYLKYTESDGEPK